MSQLGEIVRNFIANNNLDKALQELESWATKNKQNDIQQRLSVLRQRLTQVKRSVSIGTISFSDELRENAILADSILQILDEIEGLETNRSVEAEATSISTILFLAANPATTARLQLEKEHALITNKMQDFPQYRIVSQWATSPDTMIESILKYKPSIIHFSGHGAGEDADGSSQIDTRALALRKKEEPTGIILEDGAGGVRIVEGEELAEMFSIFLRYFKVNVIVLNACYSEAQAKVIAKCVKYVIGMTDAVDDNAAIDFSSKLYRNIAAGLDEVDAFRLAKTNVGMNAFDNTILAMYKDGELIV